MSLSREGRCGQFVEQWLSGANLWLVGKGGNCLWCSFMHTAREHEPHEGKYG